MTGWLIFHGWMFILEEQIRVTVSGVELPSYAHVPNTTNFCIQTKYVCVKTDYIY